MPIAPMQRPMHLDRKVEKMAIISDFENLISLERGREEAAATTTNINLLSTQDGMNEVE